MPRTSEKHPIKDPFLDRRTKLLPCQKEMVLYWHELGLSSRKLSALFHVSRRLIQFIVDPEKHKENLQAREERGGSGQYYNRKEHATAMRKHRKHKDDIYHKLISNESKAKS